MTKESDLQSLKNNWRKNSVNAELHKKLAKRARQQKLFWRNRRQQNLDNYQERQINPK